jgi:hypothetical protein
MSAGHLILRYVHLRDSSMPTLLTSLTYLPSSHGGGELPGNQIGLSGPSGSHTVDTPPLVAFARRCGVLVNDADAAPSFRCGVDLGAWMLAPLQKRSAQRRTAAACEKETLMVWRTGGAGCAMPFVLTLAGGCRPRTSRRTTEP